MSNKKDSLFPNRTATTINIECMVTILLIISKCGLIQNLYRKIKSPTFRLLNYIPSRLPRRLRKAGCGNNNQFYSQLTPSAYLTNVNTNAVTLNSREPFKLIFTWRSVFSSRCHMSSTNGEKNLLHMRMISTYACYDNCLLFRMNKIP